MLFLSDIFDVTLLSTIAIIFAVTLLGAYLRSRRRDPCLHAFDGFPVTLEKIDNKIIWGELQLAPTGMELCYRDMVQDMEHIESSYVFYAEEYEEIQAIYRYVDQMSEENKERRNRDMRRSFHPNLYWRLNRSLQHFFATANESLTDVFGLLVGRLQKPAARYLDETGAERIKNLSANVFTRSGHAHDQLLERFVGQRVVAEIMEGDEIHEHIGIFKNYSADFIELLDVQFPEKNALSEDHESDPITKQLSIKPMEGGLKITNHSPLPVLVLSVKDKAVRDKVPSEEGNEEPLNVVVDGGETIELYLETKIQDPQLDVRIVRDLDMIVPRSRAVIRHRAESYKPEVLFDIIFDLGIVLRKGGTIEDIQEARLRRQMDENPHDGWPISRLGVILMRRQLYDEAESLFEQALERSYSLPDSGRRTMMLLRELRRRKAKIHGQPKK